jgi:probable HAF family extracellular repeat protein
MKKAAMVVLFGPLIFTGGVSYAAEAPYKFKILDIPLHFTLNGQQRDDIVRLTDINNNGQLVGNDFASDGFFLSGRNKVTEIRCPSDVTDNDGTTVSAINNRGEIVGSCTDGGFVRDKKGNIAVLNFPGADTTLAFGINDLGHVVGQYGGSLFGSGLDRFHGFLWQDGVYTTIDAPFPDAMHTTLLAINKRGQIIGTYLRHRPGSSEINDYDSEVAFLYDNGNFTVLDFPGAKTPFLCCGPTTFPMDINNRGQVIGSTYDGNGNPQFFLYDDGEYLVITGLSENVLDAYDYSVVHGPSAWGINDKREIAGTYLQRVPCETCGIAGEDGYRFERHSFIAVPQKPSKKNELVN